MEYTLKFGILLTICIEGAGAYEVCRKIQHVTVTFCKDGFYCCDNNTRCCHEGSNPLVIAAVVLGCILAIAFIIASIFLCVKGNNHDKSGQPDTTSQEIEIAYTGELPPPYLAYLETDGTGLELPTYPGQPPPYEPTTDSAQSNDATTSVSVEACCQRIAVHEHANISTEDADKPGHHSPDLHGHSVERINELSIDSESSNDATTSASAEAHCQRIAAHENTDISTGKVDKSNEHHNPNLYRHSREWINEVIDECSGEGSGILLQDILNVTLDTQSNGNEEVCAQTEPSIKGKT